MCDIWAGLFISRWCCQIVSTSITARLLNKDESWLDFVSANRQGIYQGIQYDLVYGAVANDDVYRTITLYMTGILNKEQALAALKIRKLFNQLVFATEKSLKYLHFEGRELV